METSFATARLHPDLAARVRALHGARVVGGRPERHLELPVAGTVGILALEHL